MKYSVQEMLTRLVGLCALGAGLMLLGCSNGQTGSTSGGSAATSPTAAPTPAAVRYCKVDWQGEGNLDETSDHYEGRIRAKCQVGDIISGNWAESIARFCDLTKPVYTMSGGAGAFVCYLAPKRETY